MKKIAAFFKNRKLYYIISCIGSIILAGSIYAQYDYYLMLLREYGGMDTANFLQLLKLWAIMMCYAVTAVTYIVAVCRKKKTNIEPALGIVCGVIGGISLKNVHGFIGSERSAHIMFAFAIAAMFAAVAVLLIVKTKNNIALYILCAAIFILMNIERPLFAYSDMFYQLLPVSSMCPQALFIGLVAHRAIKDK